jgi:hypothetical protein
MRSTRVLAPLRLQKNEKARQEDKDISGELVAMCIDELHGRSFIQGYPLFREAYPDHPIHG